MDELNKVNLDEFLKQYGFDESDNLTDKQKLNVLKRIIFNNDVEHDLVEMRFASISEDAKTTEVIENFVKEIGNLDLENIQVKGYIYTLKQEIHDKRKLKRKEDFQKVLTFFKKK